ncbi:MAG: hypothetical protein GX776_07470, partial [Oxalobacter sp.]|nr:hypothetical protein [Oxalobacter sp.]
MWASHRPGAQHPKSKPPKKTVKEAQASFASLIRLPAYHRIDALYRKAKNTAADTAIDEAEDAASDAGGVGNKEEAHQVAATFANQAANELVE